MKYLKKNKKKDFPRSARVSQELQREISIIIQNNIKDPRINFPITISMVQVSSDLSSAKIFFSYLDDFLYDKNCFNNPNDIRKILYILQKASGYIRKKLCQKLNLRIIPILNFYYDNSLLAGKKISNLIQDALKII